MKIHTRHDGRGVVVLMLHAPLRLHAWTRRHDKPCGPRVLLGEEASTIGGPVLNTARLVERVPGPDAVLRHRFICLPLVRMSRYHFERFQW